MSSGPSPAAPRPLRRQYLVNRPYQGRFIGLFCALSMAMGAVSGGAVYLVVGRALSHAMYRSHLPTGEVWHFVGPPLRTANLILAAASLIVAAIAVHLTLRRAARMVRAVESDIRAIDRPGLSRSPVSAEPLWQGLCASVSAAILDRLRPFGDAAEILETAIARGKQTARSDTRQAALQLAADLGQAATIVEENGKKFRLPRE